MSVKTSLKKFFASKIFRIIKNKYFLATLFFIVWILFIDTNNLIRWYSDMKDVAAQERQKRYYKEAIKETDEQLKELRSNLDSLEKFAREQYYFHKADEEIFIVEDAYRRNNEVER
ncbi:MAG: septum formation initiator family protein [Bacteroidales bacterium]|nr:septum formation initiator family protein [Bacteroidales bacterium]